MSVLNKFRNFQMTVFRANLLTQQELLQVPRAVSGRLELARAYPVPATPTCPEAKTKKKGPKMKTLQIYRYNPECPQKKPHLQKFTIDLNKCGGMVLDGLTYIKSEMDPTLSYRRSCREAICGCCAINIRGVNSLACITPMEGKERVLRLYPLPHMYVLRDLVTDQSHFFDQYNSIEPWLQRRPSEKIDPEAKEFLQSPRDRAKLDGLYECILCGCCSASCPPYWWNYKKYLGPAVLMQAYRWIVDSRDDNHKERLYRMTDYYSAYRCHTIMNCTNCCPKHLNPGLWIAELKRMLIGLKKKETPDMDSDKDSEQKCMK